MKTSNLIRVEEAALILGVSWRTVERMVERKQISRVKYGGQWRYKRAEIEKFKDSGAVAA